MERIKNVDKLNRDVLILKNMLREACTIIMGEYPKDDERHMLASSWIKLANE